MLIALLFIGAVVALDLLAYFFGVDSRRTLDDERRPEAYLNAAQHGLQ